MTMDRDMVANPYSKDERRLVDWLNKDGDIGIGGGPDPLGFFLSSYDFLISQREDLKKRNVTLNQALANAHVTFAAEITAMQAQIKQLGELRKAAEAWLDKRNDGKTYVISSADAVLGNAVNALNGRT